MPANPGANWHKCPWTEKHWKLKRCPKFSSSIPEFFVNAETYYKTCFTVIQRNRRNTEYCSMLNDFTSTGFLGCKDESIY
uniref:Uncharacterized protein n=1 Tax=Romanomermis culicivorax TaxID=13658 RepID=A0A915IH52_ROMCU